MCGEPTAGKYGVCGRGDNPECIRERGRRERADRKEHINQLRREHYAANREAACRRIHEYRVVNREELSRKQREYHAANREELNRRGRERYAANREECSQKKRDYAATLRGRAVILLNSARSRANAKSLPFDLTLEWVEGELEKALANGCPYLGIPITLNKTGRRPGSDSPSIDQIDPGAGYIRDNCIIVSRRANTIKNDATLDELELLTRNVARVSRAARVKAA